MTRSNAAYVICALGLCVALGAAGFPRQAVAGFITFLALLGCRAPRCGLLAQITLALGLVTAIAGGHS